MTYVVSACESSPLPSILAPSTAPPSLEEVETQTKLRVKYTLGEALFSAFFASLKLVHTRNGRALWSLPIPPTPVHIQHKTTLVQCMDMDDIHAVDFISRGSVRAGVVLQAQPQPEDTAQVVTTTYAPASKRKAATTLEHVKTTYHTLCKSLGMAAHEFPAFRYAKMEDGIVHLDILAYHPSQPPNLIPKLLLECWQRVEPDVQSLHIRRLFTTTTPEVSIMITAETQPGECLANLLDIADYERAVALGNDLDAPRRIFVEDIQHVVARYFGLTKHELCGNKRLRRYVKPRQIAMYLCKQLTSRTFPEIGDKFGKRDHTTALHSVRKTEEMIQTNAVWAHDVRKLTELILQPRSITLLAAE